MVVYKLGLNNFLFLLILYMYIQSYIFKYQLLSYIRQCMQQVINKINTQQSNHQTDKNSCNHCTDLPYLIICLLFIIGMSIASIISYDPDKLKQLGLPVNNQGKICSSNQPYLVIDQNKPTLEQRYCSAYCEQPVSYLFQGLGGLCISARIQYILKMNGEYQHYLEQKINALNMINNLKWIACISLVAAVIYTVISKILSASKLDKLKDFFIIFLPLLIFIAAIILLLENLSISNQQFEAKRYVWVVICLITLLFTLGIIFTYFRSNQQLPISQNQKSKLSEFLIICCCSILNLLLFCLVLFSYLALKSSEEYHWQQPNLFMEASAITFKSVLIFMEALLLISLNFSICQYLLGGYSLVSQDKISLKSIFRRMICQHFGSVCKSALLNIIFFIPIQILNFLKPKRQKSMYATICSCLCGIVLNISQRYAPPVLAYQASCIQTLNYDQCAAYLQKQSNLQQDEYSKIILYQVNAFLMVIGINILANILLQQQYQTLNILGMLLVIIVGIWIGGPSAKLWAISSWGYRIRTNCQLNRCNWQLNDNIQ